MGDGVPTDIERHAKGDDDAAATLEVSSFTAGKHSSRVYYRPAGSSIQTEAGEDEDQRQGDEVQNDDTERPPSKQISRRERRSFLALREGALGLVVDACLSTIVTAEDGGHLGTFILSHIDHWDYEKERVFLIMENVLLCAKYDFSKQQVMSAIRLPYYGITKIIRGKFVYPRLGVASKRDGTGLRVHFSCSSPPFWSLLNPWADDIPYWTITSHILRTQYKVPDDRLNIDIFTDKLMSAIYGAFSRLQGDKDPDCTQPEIEEQDVYMDTYMNMTAMLHNGQHMGYYKEKVTS